MRRKSVLTYFFVSAGSIVAGGVIGDLLFPHANPHVAQPIEQAVAFIAAFLLLWPLEIRHQPERRIRSFSAYAAVMIVIAGTIAAIRIGLGTG
jgi:zinc transporter ZupT